MTLTRQMGLIKDRGKGQYLSPGALIGFLVWMCCIDGSVGNGRYGYFSKTNNSQVLLRNTIWDVTSNNIQIEFSFRTCSDGELIYQNGTSGDFLQLNLTNSTLEFHWEVNDSLSDSVQVHGSFNENEWFNVNIHRFLGNLYLNVSKSGRVFYSEIISNSTFRTYFSDIDLTGSSGLYVGRDFTGCFMQGVNVIFLNNVNLQSQNVVWSNNSCTQSDNTCADIATGDQNSCYLKPCVRGQCVDGDGSNFTCICPHLYNGTLCENDLSVYGCDVEPCLNGGTCNTVDGTPNYRCDCVNGFVGINCESDIDECELNPCDHDTQCIDQVGSYLCNCTGSGFNGTDCDQDINECEDPLICGTNGNCTNNIGSYNCQCAPGYFGYKCQAINECQSNPCQNNASCVDSLNDFTCNCIVGYTGRLCEHNIDDCVDVTCPGTQSICRDLVNDYECVCKPGYSGFPGNCEDIDECLSSPCKNGASCTNLEDDYSCQCVPGYTDKNCLTNINECDNNPCQNGASCEDGINRYTCQCLPGFNGDNCQNNINECDLYQEPCFNGGSCNDQINGFNCTCAAGFMGDRCTININECESNPCGVNFVRCIEGTGTFTCECKDGFTGATCETNINECNSNPCRNGGQCHDQVNGYTCNCTALWMGTNCELVFDACSPEFENCKNGANCSTVPPSQDFNCSCRTGYRGDQCEENINDCLPTNDCVAPKKCYDGENEYECRCPRGYEGLNCTIDIDECQSDPCQNGATCTQGLGDYTCSCGSKIAYVPETNGNRSYTTGYEGVNCEHDINECDIVPSICLNGGICQNEPGSFQCLCGRDVEGTYFTGSHCEIQTSYCYIAEDVKNDQPACKNNGTCKGIIGNYTCDCAPGFTDRRCETDINECESSPCQYNGTCNDGINGYTCDCIPGITGTNCETNIQECNSNPCLNYGQCIDDINRYDCNCTDTGFKGDNCEINIDDCESNPCIHGSTCFDKIKDYNCLCLEGYTGKNCETDIDECLSTPCFYNSTCLQKSNETLYNIGVPLFENLTFSYDDAAGYLCDCVNGSTGVNCEININDCFNDSCNNQGACIDLLNDFRCECYAGYTGTYCQTEINECEVYQACEHGSTCVDKVADYECLCAEEFNGKIYAGKNCTFELTACENNLCDKGACEPYLINEANRQQDYRCLCEHGYTGRFCNVSTTMSFNKTGSYLIANLQSSTNTYVSFRFRTTLSHSVLLAWLDSSQTSLFVSVELVDGNICMFNGSYTYRQCIPNKHFNEESWHNVIVNVTSTHIHLTVSSHLCTNQADCVITSTASNINPSQVVHFGSLQGTNIISDGVHGSQFIGCMEDITVDSSRLSLLVSDNRHSYVGLFSGCLRIDQCFISTCSEKGTCVDLWNRFRCDCFRPYLGTTCNTEQTAATFAFNNSESFATFTVPSNVVIPTTLDLSFFMRSRQSNNLMMFYGSNTEFLTAGLDSGHVEIRIYMCNLQRKVLTDSGVYSDGERHLIRLHRNATIFEFYVDGARRYQTSDITGNCQFTSENLHFGGKTPLSARKRRDVIVTNNNVGNFDSITDFKGTIQDIQMNDNSLEFFPLDDPNLNPLPSIALASSTGLQENEVTDPTCEMITPCENNSTCTNVFFNDYRCDCLLGYRGKNCSDLDFCVTGLCPNGTVCQSLLDGFECISNATFNGRDSVAIYTHNIPTTNQISGFSFKFRTLSMNGISNATFNGRDSVAIYSHNIPSTNQISGFSFKFRTLSMNGKMLKIGTSSRYYRAQLIGSQLVVFYRLDDMEESRVTAEVDVSDSRWYSAEIVEESATVTLTLKDYNNMTLSNVSSPRPSNGDSLGSILSDSSTNIVVGINEPYDQRQPFYQGCFSEIRIGKILLPFFYDEEFVNNTSKERFLLQSGSENFVHGCQAGNNCQYSQCRASWQCVEDYYTYTCDCAWGVYEGRWCLDQIDRCLQGDECFNGGHCYTGFNETLCQCPAGYIGDQCQTDVTECSTQTGVCQNGGTCQNDNGTFSCNCPADTLGDRCEGNLTDTCDNNPCVHGSCNSINVTDSTGNTVESFNCSCDLGYHGYTCDLNIDYCVDLPCKNGGNCTSVGGTFSCECPSAYTGPTCSEEVNDCPIDACKNGGICVDGFERYACNCTPSIYYKGEDCTVDIDECLEQQPCQNSGLCINLQGGFTCDCRNTGYNGTYCENDVNECVVDNPCRNGASCTNTIGDYICNCTEGYEGKNCQTPNCSAIDCTVGLCRVESVFQTWYCECPQFYEGTYCEIKGLCVDRPCFTAASHTTRCEQNSTYSFECICDPGWQGTVCEVDIDECLNVTCLNGATCVNTAGSFRCDCADGYTDTFCQTEINECESQPCKNGGICTDLVADFECNCNGTGYTNDTCEDDINECLDSPCTNGGVCQNTNGNYTCACPEEFEGRNCEIKVSAIMEEEDITWYIVGPAVAVVLILIIIGIVCFVKCVRKKRATRGAYSPSRQEVTGSRVELGNVMKKPPLERLI